jgi:small subunit ribosomal protein S1
VVTFGAFVEILDGVEGLVHISELAPHHVESPREIVHPGDEIRVKILEIDSERRRLSLSAKRVEDQILPISRPAEPEADVTEESSSTDAGQDTAGAAAPPPAETEEAQGTPEASAEAPQASDAAPGGETIAVPGSAEAAPPEAGEASQAPAAADGGPSAADPAPVVPSDSSQASGTGASESSAPPVESPQD